MKHYILYNPHAGRGLNEQSLGELVTKYEQAQTINMTKIDAYKDFFAGLERDDVIILCGGDGTLNRFVNDTDGIEYENDILYFPAGTGNDFLNDIKDEVGAPPFDVKKYIASLPTVEINGRSHKFINGVGYGIDGYCCEVGDELKAQEKEVNYTSIAIKGLLFHYKPANARVTVDGQEYFFERVWIAPTMNGRFYGGGMMPTPAQNRMSGELSVMIWFGSGKLRTLTAFPSLFKGEHLKHEKMIKVLSGKEITVAFDSPRALQIDGETVRGVSSYTAKVPAPAKVKA